MIVDVEEAINQRGQLTAQDPLHNPDVPASQAVQPFAGQK